jgi:hypothetical protein
MVKSPLNVARKAMGCFLSTLSDRRFEDHEKNLVLKCDTRQFSVAEKDVELVILVEFALEG